MTTTLAWIRCVFVYPSAIRSLCVRGSWSAQHRIPSSTIELSATESRLSPSLQLYLCRLVFMCAPPPRSCAQRAYYNIMRNVSERISYLLLPPNIYLKLYSLTPSHSSYAVVASISSYIYWQYCLTPFCFLLLFCLFWFFWLFFWRFALFCFVFVLACFYCSWNTEKIAHYIGVGILFTLGGLLSTFVIITFA